MDFLQDTVTEAYDTYGAVPRIYNLFHRMKFLREEAWEALELKEGQNVLDVGCGTGLNFSRIIEGIGSGKVLGVDISSKMVAGAGAVARQWENVEIWKGDIVNVPLEGEVFDRVLSFLSLSCVPNHLLALENVFRSLKKSGRLVIVDGQKFTSPYLNVAMPFLRWDKSWDRQKDLLGDIQKHYAQEIKEIKEYSLGSNFLTVIEKTY